MSKKLTYQDAEIIQRGLKQLIDTYKSLREVPVRDALAVNSFLQIGEDEMPEGMSEADMRKGWELELADIKQVSDKLNEIFGV